MNEECVIQLQTDCILNVPLLIYGEFTFIVNGKEFKTSRLISDLLSPTISQIHKVDPSVNKFEIKTNYEGDFSYILNLVGFNQITIPDKEFPFICEVIEILGVQSINIKDTKTPITNDSVFALIHKHEQYSNFYAKSLEEEIGYISQHFYEIIENHEEELKELSECALKKILMNPNLSVIDEDQVLTFVNHLYMKDPKYSALYEYVSFENVEGGSMDQFLEIFNISNLTIGIWKSLSKRLSQRNNKIKKNEVNQYKQQQEQRHPHFAETQPNHTQSQQQYPSMQLHQQPQNPIQQIQNPPTQPHHQPQYPPIQPHQLQELQQQLLQQQEEQLLKQHEDFLRQHEEERLRDLQIEDLQQRVFQQHQEHQDDNNNQNQNQVEIHQENAENQSENHNLQTKHESKLFPYDSNNQFSGILDYLNKESRGNIDDIISVTASSISGRSFPSNVTFLLDRNRRFCSSGVEQNPWICFDFRDFQVIPSNYTIRSCDSGYDPKSWVIEGSKDSSNWEILDEQKNCNFLNGDFKTHTFDINNSKSQQFRYLRMRLTDTNWKNDYAFIINSFELYGTLI